MSSMKLTQEEAERLIDMTKRSLISVLKVPLAGKDEEFNVVGDSKKDIFTVNIYRGEKNPLKYNLGARIKKNGIMLLQLHITPTTIHRNPDGEKITGNHWHIYSEEYGRLWAFPADNIESNNFVKNTIDFLEKFNVIEKPEVIFQLELV